MAKRKRRVRGEGACFYSEAKDTWVARAVVGAKPDGSPLYKEVTAKTQGEVLAKKRKAEEEASAGNLDTGKPVLLGDYLQHWLDHVAKPSVRLSTWQSYERCVRLHLKRSAMAGVRLGDLRPHHVEKYFSTRMEDGMSAGNAKKVGEVLATALEHAARTNLIRSSPASPVKKPQPPEEEIVPFTPDEVKAVLAQTHHYRLGALVAVAFGTGARQGELLGLGWDHLDLKAAVMRVERSLAPLQRGEGFLLKEPKSKRGRRAVDLPRFVVEAFTAHRARMLAEGNLSAQTVFCTEAGGFMDKSNLRSKLWEPLLRRAGVPYRKFHTARHTHVSELLSRGESVVDVARRVGDRPEVILKTYAHFIPGNKGKITGRLDEMYG